VYRGTTFQVKTTFVLKENYGKQIYTPLFSEEHAAILVKHRSAAIFLERNYTKNCVDDLEISEKTEM
jgi:hypothetical protein